MNVLQVHDPVEPKRERIDSIGWLSWLGMAGMLVLTLSHWGGVYPHVAGWAWVMALLPAVALAIFAAWGIKAGKVPADWIDFTVLVFLAYAVWTYGRTPVEYTARLELLWIFTYAIIFWSMRYTLPGRRTAAGLLAVLLVAGVGTAAYGLWHRGDPMHLIWGLPSPNYGVRISGTFGCPNHFGNFLVTAILAALALAAYSKLSWPVRIFCVYLAAVMTLAVVLSISRGAYLAWIAGCSVAGIYFCRTLPVRWYWKLGMVLIAFAAAIGGVAVYGEAMDRVEKALDGDIRLLLARESIKIWQTEPLWGRGIGSFDYLYLRMHGPDLQARAHYSHNDYLNTLADYGAVGLGIVLVFLLAVFWQLVKRIYTGGSDAKGAGDWRRTLWAWLGLAVLAAMAMHSLFDFSLHIPACAVAFFMVLGIAVQRPRREWRSARWFANPAIFVVLVPPILAGVLLWQAWIIVPTQRALPPGDREIKEMSVDEIERLGEKLLARDPKAYPLLTKVGDAFRVRAAEKRENFGRRGLPREERQELLREQHRLANLALRYYQAAHTVAPLNDALLARQALVLDLMRRHEEAFLAYQEALRNQPLNRYFHLALGFHFVESAQWQEALDAFQRASQIRQGPRESPEIQKQAKAAAQFVRERMQSDN